MKASPKPEPRIKMLKLDILIAFGLLILVIILSVWYSHHKTTPNGTTSTTAGWTHYASNKYGLQFDYPGSWGQPQITTIPGKTGSHYQIIFAADPQPAGFNKNLSVVIGMDSTNYAASNCSSGCTPLTSKTIQNNLKTGAKSLLQHDDSSYAFLGTIGNNSILTDVQTVSISKIDVTGAIAIYSLRGNGGCPAGKFASAAQKSCISSGDYNNLNEALKSIKAF